jgi:hypothetical protein
MEFLLVNHTFYIFVRVISCNKTEFATSEEEL